MKKSILSILVIFMTGTVALFAQTKTEKFEVKGNCETCEKRIEKAANAVDGVTKADWNKQTKIMKVTFDESKTTVSDIKKAIVDVGHDVGDLKASDETYNQLPDCCKYKRE